MDADISKREQIFEKLLNKKIIIIIAIIILLIIGAIAGFASYVFNYQKIFNNISVLGIDVGGLSKEEALAVLDKQINSIEGKTIALNLENSKETINFKDIAVVYMTKNIVEDAYKVGREGNAFTRYFEILKIQFSGKPVVPTYYYDTEKLYKICDKFEKEIKIDPKDDTFEVKNNILTFNYGYVGRGIDKEDIKKRVEESIKGFKSAEINTKIVDIPYQKLDADTLPSEPKDASYKVENYRNIVYIKEQPGIIFDKAEFTKLLNDNFESKRSFSMPVEATFPKVTVENLKAKMFKSTLGSFVTYYGSSPDNRKVNVRLAASKIENVILGPGDEFSFNKIVGARTEDRGFKKAHVYSNGKIIDDFGGGICQVSTTLYNAALRADLGITERKNHMFTVSYAQPGLDATVSYGIDDFRFKNTLKYPVKIINNTTSSNVGFTIIGVMQNEGKTIEFKREILKTIPFTVKETKDPNIDEGKTIVDQNGMDGYVVNTYKITKQNGNIIKEEFLHKSSYRSLEKIVRIGTKPVVKSTEINESKESGTVNTTSKEATTEQTKPQEVPAIKQDQTNSTLQ